MNFVELTQVTQYYPIWYQIVFQRRFFFLFRQLLIQQLALIVPQQLAQLGRISPLRFPLHGLDTFWARGLSWIHEDTTTTTTTTTTTLNSIVTSYTHSPPPIAYSTPPVVSSVWTQILVRAPGTWCHHWMYHGKRLCAESFVFLGYHVPRPLTKSSVWTLKTINWIRWRWVIWVNLMKFIVIQKNIKFCQITY